ncbi:MAG: hypothetical protein IJK31_00570 [Ruminococcus sp.]|nr:hypothetical protein [Ruminococcus sp.]HRR75329.1 hypothetical protein [Ruminococcus sp.]
MILNDERGTGVFGSVGDTVPDTSGESKKLLLKPIPEDSPETIYNLIFREAEEGHD